MQKPNPHAVRWVERAEDFQPSSEFSIGVYRNVLLVEDPRPPRRPQSHQGSKFIPRTGRSHVQR